MDFMSYFRSNFSAQPTKSPKDTSAIKFVNLKFPPSLAEGARGWVESLNLLLRGESQICATFRHSERSTKCVAKNLNHANLKYITHAKFIVCVIKSISANYGKYEKLSLWAIAFHYAIIA